MERKMELFNKLNLDMGYVVIGMAAVLLITFILLMVFMVKYTKLQKNYKKFMMTSDGNSIEKELQIKFNKVNSVASKIRVIEDRLDGIDETLVKTYQKMGIVKYDAFKEMGGKLSFSLALLNQDNTGILISSMHSREGCYTYTKEIIKGESFVLLADEEREALDQAMQKDVI